MSEKRISIDTDKNKDQLVSKIPIMKIPQKRSIEENRKPLASIGNRQTCNNILNTCAVKKPDHKYFARQQVGVNLKKDAKSESNLNHVNQKKSKDSKDIHAKVQVAPIYLVKKSTLDKCLPQKSLETAKNSCRVLTSSKIKETEPIGLKYFELMSGHSFKKIENIDENDKKDVVQASEYINDIYSYLMRLENDFVIQQNFLKNHAEINPNMRSILVEWINEVHSELNLTTETYFLAISILDRYTQKVSDLPRKNYQLVGTTALFIAAKFEETYPRKVDEYAYMTDDTYSAKEIIDMELKMLNAIDFCLNCPLSTHFIRRYAKASKINTKKYLACKYLLELATVDYNLATKKPSEISAAALYIVLYVFNTSSKNNIWTETLEFYTTYKANQLQPTVKQLANVVLSAIDSNPTSFIVDKYSHSIFEKISTLELMRGEKIQNLAID